MTPADLERDRTLLAERARALAHPLIADPAGDQLTLVTFELAGEQYGIEAQCVCGLFRLMDLAPFPGAPPPTVGLTAWRGDLLAVLDPRSILGLGAAALDDRSWIVVIGREAPRFGLLAGALRDVLTIRPERVRPAPGARGAPGHPVVRGVTDDAVLVLEADALLAGSG